MELLRAEELTVTFGGVKALSGLNLRVEEGQLVGLIGPNGAGKTTALDALSGFVTAKGAVTFRGHDLTGASPVERVKAGLVRTWQSARSSSMDSPWQRTSASRLSRAVSRRSSRTSCGGDLRSARSSGGPWAPWT